ncbi:MAG: STM3941 family protein [Bacteroidales bacterium]
MNKIEIPLSKKKISLLFTGATAFVIFGTLFLITPDTFTSPIFRNNQTIRVVGIVVVLFFGVVGISVYRKLIDTKIGLTIDENGITDNSNASSVGLIEWADIIEVKSSRVMSTKFLLVFTDKPDKYINRTNGFKRTLLKGNIKTYGTPISITSNTLKYDFEELESLIKKSLLDQNEKN